MGESWRLLLPLKRPKAFVSRAKALPVKISEKLKGLWGRKCLVTRAQGIANLVLQMFYIDCVILIPHVISNVTENH